jgi:hypothetical protein
MSKLHKNKHGFVAPEMTLILVVTILIIVVGWLVYQHYDKTNAAIILQRQQHIDKSISDLSLRNYTSFGTSLYKGGYLTTSLYNTTQSLISSYSDGNFDSNPAYAKIICIDEIPGAYSYGTATVSTNSTTATIPVKVFVPGSTTATPYTAYWVNTNGTWQLNNVTCS